MFTIELDKEIYSTYGYQKRPMDCNLMFECLMCRVMKFGFLSVVDEFLNIRLDPSSIRN